MTFYISKIFWVLFQPLNLMALMIIGGLLLRRGGTRKLRRISQILIALPVLSLLVFGFTNVPDYLLYRLENAYQTKDLPDNPAGIIILGGGLDLRIGSGRDGGYSLNSSGDRLFKGFELARKYPDIPLVYSSGPISFGTPTEPGADAAQRISRALFGRDRFILEKASRNTWENAINTYKLLKPKKDETWIIVTSAFHALRSAGCFRKAGFNVVVAATDFRSYYKGSISLTWRSMEQLAKTGIVFRETVGLIAYRLMGRLK